MTIPDIDYSELAGRKAECPDGCGMCCLCQPEVLPREMAFFRKNRPDCVTKTRGQDSHFCIKMKKGRGSCVLLDGRRCTIYADRPTFCRQFPYHFYAGDRISVELDLSCRGVWTGNGADAAEEARALAEASESRLAAELKESSEVYREFYSICREDDPGEPEPGSEVRCG